MPEDWLSRRIDAIRENSEDTKAWPTIKRIVDDIYDIDANTIRQNKAKAAYKHHGLRFILHMVHPRLFVVITRFDSVAVGFGKPRKQ